jgi:hypothetical protein
MGGGPDLESIIDAAREGEWSAFDRVDGALRKLTEDQRRERETLARMVASVLATPAGEHVMRWLVNTYVLRTAYHPDLGNDLNSVAMNGIWNSAQAELVKQLLGLATQGGGWLKPEGRNDVAKLDDAGPDPQVA